MSDAFDPYYKWLGIPPSAQPPDHYRLLGLQLFEENADVIDSGAERQMVFLRNYQIGKHSQFSQKLLNEIAAARICLLNPAKKAAYDAKLRSNLSTVPPAAAAVAVLPTPAPVNLAPSGVVSSPTAAEPEQKPSPPARICSTSPRMRMWLALGIGVGAVLVAGLSTWLVPRTVPSLQWEPIDRRSGEAVVLPPVLKPAVAARRPPKLAAPADQMVRVEVQPIVPVHVGMATKPETPATAHPTSLTTSDHVKPQNPQPITASMSVSVPIPHHDIAEPRRNNFDRIELPTGSQLTEAMVNRPEQWRALFPPTALVYVDSYKSPDDEDKVIVRGGYTLKKGDLKTLHGPAVRFFDDGSLATLAEYQSSLLHGKLRVWDEQGHRVYYGEYLQGRKNGLVCVFCDGSPWLIQQCERWEINAQYLVVFKRGTATAIPEDKLGPDELADFKKGVGCAPASGGFSLASGVPVAGGWSCLAGARAADDWEAQQGWKADLHRLF